MKKISLVLAFAISGLIVGYLIFGKWGGEYVSLKTIFSFGGNGFQSAFRSLSGVEDMRNKVLLCGAAGAVVGLLLNLRSKR
ncbi:MAG: hypothetical protein C0406_07135 [Sideroxydans sp.]|nr:hypothetical protein [Sideroxydans sp.]